MAGEASSRKAPANDPPLKNKKTKLGASVESSRSGTPAHHGDGAHPTPNTTKPGTNAAGVAGPVVINSDGIETQKCKHCKKFVPKEGFQGHSKQCLRDKKELNRQREAQAAEKAAAAAAAANGTTSKPSDAEGDAVMENASNAASEPVKASRQTNGTAGPEENVGAGSSTAAASSSAPKKKADAAGGDADTVNAKKTKKRKADDTAAAETAIKPPTKKQKKKEEAAKPKAPKPKGPVDVEKQCGVQMENGNLCARSLTCKSHAMGAKRAVPGRSAPYDVLLAQYQKKNQAKQQKAAIASNAPPADELDGQSGPVDSDEERDAVMAGLARANPRPLISRPMVSVRARYDHIRIKEMLVNAMGGNRGASLFSLARNNPAEEEDTAAQSSGHQLQPQSQTQQQQQQQQQQGSFAQPQTQQHFRTPSVSAAVGM